MKAEAWETLFIGIIAEQFGTVNVTHLCNAGKAVFAKLDTMTYKEFRNIKKLLKERKRT